MELKIDNKIIDELDKIALSQGIEPKEIIESLIKSFIIANKIETKNLKKKRSIIELSGLGKELWQDIDVEKHIENERNSWN